MKLFWQVEILLPPANAVPGDCVEVEGYVRRPDAVLNPKKKIWETVAPDLKVDSEKMATYKGAVLTIPGKGPVTSPSLVNVQIKWEVTMCYINHLSSWNKQRSFWHSIVILLFSFTYQVLFNALSSNIQEDSINIQIFNLEFCMISIVFIGRKRFQSQRNVSKYCKFFRILPELAVAIIQGLYWFLQKISKG